MLIQTRNREPEEVVGVFASDRFTITTGTYHDEYPTSKLTTDSLGDYWLAWGQRKSHSWIQVHAAATGGTDDRVIGCVSVLNINRLMPTLVPEGIPQPNQARLIIDYFDHNNIINPAVVSPGFSTTNLTAFYGTPNFAGSSPYMILNQPFNPPEVSLSTPYVSGALNATSDTTNTVVNLWFDPESTRPLVSGVDVQVIRVHVRDSLDKEDVPTIQVVLKAFGTGDVGTLTSVSTEKSSEGYIFKYLFNAASLPSLTTQAGLRITGVTNGTSSVDILAVSWDVEVSGKLYDSDWQDIESSKQVTWLPNLTVPDGGQFYIHVQFSDFGKLVSDPGGYFTYSTFGDAFHAGRFIAGSGGDTVVVPLQSIGGFNLRKIGDNAGSLTMSYGGQLRATRQDATRWQADITITPQSESRMFGQLSQFFDDVGFVLPALYVPNDGIVDQSIQHPGAMWGIIVSFEAPDLGLLTGSDTSTDPPYTEDKRFDLRMSIIEAQANLTRRGE